MAIKIGTNFSYNGRQFLDSRQRVMTKRTLLSWSIAVPEGFEVYCEEGSKWYVYDSSYTDSQTGHFKLRIEKELEDSEIQANVDSNTEDITKLDKEVFPLRFDDVNGGGDFSSDKQLLPLITWKVYKGTEKVTADRVFVNGVLSRYKERYMPDTYITESTTYTIEAYYGDEYCTIDVPVNLYPYRYVFVSSSPSVTNSWILAQTEQAGKFIKELSKPLLEDKEYSLDCSGKESEGGVYVHLVFPAEIAQNLVNGQLKMLVGGIEYSDFTQISPALVINDETYYNLVFTYPQNSSKLDIILKHQ